MELTVDGANYKNIAIGLFKQGQQPRHVGNM